jgi:hypothetical protein
MCCVNDGLLVLKRGICTIVIILLLLPKILY